eukprot:SAG31_NODE_196_length_20699_cov_103.813835_13_plen_132_part_00
MDHKGLRLHLLGTTDGKDSGTADGRATCRVWTPASDRAYSLNELHAWVDDCHDLRVDKTATNDCVPTAVQLLRCLRAGWLVTESVAQETGASYFEVLYLAQLYGAVEVLNLVVFVGTKFNSRLQSTATSSY